MRVLLSLLVLLGLLAASVHAWAPLNTRAFYLGDRPHYHRLLQSSRTSKGWGSAEATADAISVYQALSTAVPDAAGLCKPLEASFTEAIKEKDLVDTHYWGASLLGIGCVIPAATTAELKTLLQSGLDSNVLNDIYHATTLISALVEKKKLVTATDFNWSRVNANVVELLDEDGSFRSGPQDDEGSAYHAGLALQIAGKVSKFTEPELLRKLSSKLPAILALGLKDKSVDFSFGAPNHVSTLEAVASVIEGIKAISSVSSGTLDINKDQLDRLVSYVLQHKIVADVEDGAALLGSLSFFSNNNIYVPLVVTAAEINRSRIRIGVTNVLGEFATKVSASVASFQLRSESSPLFKNVPLRPVDGTKTDFFMEEHASLMKAVPGWYDLKIKVEPEKGENNKYGKDTRFQATTQTVVGRIDADINGLIGEFAVTDSAKVPSDSELTSVNWPADLGTALKADSSKFLHVRLSFPVFKPSQVFLQFSEVATPIFSGKNALFVVKRNEKSNEGEYILRLNLGSTEFLESVGKGGDYGLYVQASDPLLPYSLTWSLGTITVDLSETYDPAAEVAKNFLPKPEIHHTFRAPDSRSPVIIALVFSGFIAVPFVGLLLFTILPAFTRLSLPTHPSEFLAAFLFQCSIAAILALYVLYWLSLNIFQALAALAILGLVASVTGTTALRALHLRQSVVHKKE